MSPYLDPGSVKGCWNPDFNLLCQKRVLKVWFDNDFDLELGPANLTDQRYHTERQRNILGGTVPGKPDTTYVMRLNRPPDFTSLIDLEYVQYFHAKCSKDLAWLCFYWPHELIFAVRWNERDSVLCLELAQLDTLVELTVVDGNRALGTRRLVARFSWNHKGITISSHR